MKTVLINGTNVGYGKLKTHYLQEFSEVCGIPWIFKILFCYFQVDRIDTHPFMEPARSLRCISEEIIKLLTCGASSPILLKICIYWVPAFTILLRREP
jgi:hypothetical protein